MHNPNPASNLAQEFDALFAQAENTNAFWVSKAKLRFTEEMLAIMASQGVSKKQLAEKLEVQPAQVTRLCSGLNNFTMETMVRVARALNCEFKSHLQPAGSTTHWIDVLKEEPVRRVKVSTDTFKNSHIWEWCSDSDSERYVQIERKVCSAKEEAPLYVGSAA